PGVVLAEARVAERGPAVVVAGEEPRTQDGAPMDGRRLAQAMVAGVRVATARGGEEQRMDDDLGIGRHDRLLTPRPGSSGSGPASCSARRLDPHRGSPPP